MCYLVCGVVNIKDILLLIGKISHAVAIGVSLIKTFLPSSFHSSIVFKFDPHYWSTELEYVCVLTGARCISRVKVSAHGAMGRRIDLSLWTH